MPELLPEFQTVLGTRHPTHQTPIMAMMAMVVCPKPGSPKTVMYHIDVAETRVIKPQMAIFE